jgi:hypothetical protein
MKIEGFARFSLLLALAAGALAARTPAPAIGSPGTVNYIEGSVSINNHQLTSGEPGQAVLGQNQTLSTGKGKAEILMSPGVFLRVGDNSAVRMIAPELVNPQVEVLRGIAMLEVDNKPKDATITVLEHGATVSVLKQGLYRFDSGRPSVAVIDGKLNVSENDASKQIGKGKQIVLDDNRKLTAVNFDRNSKDDLYVWSEVRSSALAAANASTAQYVYAGNAPFYGSGWYWNPAFGMYSWLPGDGFFYSPFGYPFYSVGVFPLYRGYYGVHRGFIARPHIGAGFERHGFVPHGFVRHGFVNPGFRGAPHNGARGR